jgi:hypothetical protein
MNLLTPERVLELQEALDSQTRNNIWRKILHVMSVVGVADNKQITQASGLNRDRLRRTLDKMEAASAGFPPFFSAYNSKLKRGGQTGPAPRVYRLGESGAALCKLDGLSSARACQLEEPRAIRHALGVLDVHLAALAASLNVTTDRNLDYGDDGHIRPDNLVTLPDMTKAIFESEQDARSDFLERILRSLEHKVAFYASQQAQEFSPVVRMLIDLPRGKEWQRTLNTWRQAVEITREKHGRLPFRLLALPLSEFLANPEWEMEPTPGRWVDLAATGALATASGDAKSLAQVAQELPQFTNPERRMILAALYQELQQTGLYVNQPQPDSEFLYAIRTIYLASHDPFATALARSGVPRESLYLLYHYLRMNPGLLQLVEQTIQMDARRIHWNQSTALHRMQVVIDAFLEYHGWQSDGPLLAYSYTPDYQTRGPRRLSVNVEITDSEILMPAETEVVPGKQEIQILEESLGWVLSALFAQTHHLGLKKPPFW